MRTFTLCTLATAILCWQGPATAAPKGGTAPGQLAKQAREAMDRGDYDGAIELYTQAISNNPDAWHSYYNRGAALMRKMQHGRDAQGKDKEKGKDKGHGAPQELDPVLQDFDRAVELAGDEPGAAELYYERGKVHFERGELEQARADYEEAIERDPSLASRGYYDR